MEVLKRIAVWTVILAVAVVVGLWIASQRVTPPQRVPITVTAHHGLRPRHCPPKGTYGHPHPRRCRCRRHHHKGRHCHHKRRR